jgi:peptide/nickel transport system substrate-binding protein
MKLASIRCLALAAPLFAIMAAPVHAQDDDLTIVVPEAIINLDPCQTAHSHVGRPLKQNVVETLVELDPETAGIKPRLATSWEMIDANTWRFHLRENVKFHDGEPFTAEAVKATVERTMNPALDCITRTKFFAAAKLDVTAIDDLTVEVKTEPAQPILPILFSTLAIASPKTNPNDVERNPIGTGPYAIESWEQGESLGLRRFDDYWGGTPEFSHVNFVYRPESAVAAAMVTTGEADLAPYISVQDATNPETDVAYLNTDTVHMVMTGNVPPLDDLRVRQALNYAVDRQAFIGTIVSDQVQLASQLVLPLVNGYNPDLKPWPYDPEKAQALLAEAKADGVDVDAEIVLYGAAGFMSNQSDIMAALVEMWNAVGLNVRAQTIDKGQLVDLLSKPHEGRPPAILVSAHDNNTGDASFTIRFKYHSTGGQSETNDRELDRLIEEGEVASGEERTHLFQQAFARVNEVVPDVILFHLVAFARVAPDIDFTPNSLTNSELHVSEIHRKTAN